jgi:hypothetical protein
MSELSFRQLSPQRFRPIRDAASIFKILPPVTVNARNGAKLSFLPGAHSPGALMCLVTSSAGEQLLYPGDYCLGNSYYRESTERLLDHFSHDARHKWLLVDGTFLGHEPLASSIAESARALELFKTYKSDSKNIVIAAESPDYLFHAYIWHFMRFYTGPKDQIQRNLLVDEGLFKLLEGSFEPFIKKNYHQYDSFLATVLGETRSNYLESVRLYSLSSPFQNLPPEPYDIFCKIEDLRSILARLNRPSAAFLIGRFHQNSSSRLVQLSNDLSIHYLTGPDFALHSTAKDVSQIIRASSTRGVRPVIFHNFPARIRKTLAREGIEKGLYDIAWSSPLSLSS